MALYQLAYQGTGYKHGDVFDIDEKDLEAYKDDVQITKKKKSAKKNFRKSTKTK